MIIRKVRVHVLKNHEKVIGYLREYQSEWRGKVIAHFGGKCARCGFNDPRALQIDHVNGDGNIERKGRGGQTGRAFFVKVMADTTGRYQLLCANCNWIKRTENNENSISGRRGPIGPRERVILKLTEEQREARKATKRRLRDELKEKGMCAGCFSRPAVEGKTMCEACREYHRKRYQDKRPEILAQQKEYMRKKAERELARAVHN